MAILWRWSLCKRGRYLSRPEVEHPHLVAREAPGGAQGLVDVREAEVRPSTGVSGLLLQGPAAASTLFPHTPLGVQQTLTNSWTVPDVSKPARLLVRGHVACSELNSEAISNLNPNSVGNSLGRAAAICYVLGDL